MKIDALLKELFEKKGSDLHLKVGRPPLFRISGDLIPTPYETVTEDALKHMVFEIMPKAIAARVERDLEADFAYMMGEIARFRVNVFFQRGRMGAIMRLIPLTIPSIEDLRLPVILTTLGFQNQGLILIVGPTGSGKSTTMAALIEQINRSRPVHVVTIEDPIEFVYADKKAAINQRELGIDTWNHEEALRHVLRQDPDVIVMGEMRDLAAMELAMRAAETGHLVLSTLHTNDCKQTLDRILDTFPPEMDRLIRKILSQALLAVISQRLLRRADGKGRIVTTEVMINSPAIQQLIAAGKMGDIEHAMRRSNAYYGMQTFNQSLARLVAEGLVTEEDALQTSTNPGDLRLLLKGFASGAESIDQIRKREADIAAQLAANHKEIPDLTKGPDAATPGQATPADKPKLTRGFQF
ncbi:MAG: PilT/PilU family type 4a pilus ATPase [Planctomycetota bacterium]